MKLFILLLLLLSSSTLFSKENLTVQLHWKHQFQYAGLYTAIEKGYYKELGITVTLKEWDTDIDKIQLLHDNKADLIIGASDILMDVFKSSELVIVSAYLQKAPVALAVKPNIYFPQDLKNKKIMAIKEDLDSSVFFKMWKNSEINSSHLEIIPHNFNMESFINGEIDGVQIYITDQLFELASKNIEFNIIDANSYGIDFYDIMAIATKQLAQQNPQLIQSFKNATNKGWEYALKHKEETVDLILSKYNTQQKSKEALLFEAKRLESLILPKQYNLGEINEEKLKKIALVYLEMGSIEKINNIQEYIFSYKDFNENLNLTKEEKSYLKTINKLKICSLPNKIAIENKKFYKSIDVKIIEDISEKIHITPDFIPANTYNESLNYAKEGKCDILSIVRPTLSNELAFNLTKPFIAQPLVIVTNSDILFIDDFAKLKGKTIGIVEGHTSIKTIKQLYPNLKIREVKNIIDGLELVKKELIFGYVDMPILVSHAIKQLGFLDLKISGSLGINAGFAMAVNKDEYRLLPILEKAMSTISKDYINTLINEWYVIKYEKGIDYKLLWQTLFFATFLILITLYWNRKLHKANLLLIETKEELKIKNRELEKISITDRLTQLYNRHRLDKALYDEKNRADRYAEVFSIILLDIDHFKSVNDTYGHNVGDIVLIEIANILKENVRATDVVGRWGGEEFLIICTNSDIEATKIVAEKCRSAIESFEFTTIKHKTSSFGLSTYKKEKSIEGLIKEADDNLYKAKERGRNRVIF